MPQTGKYSAADLQTAAPAQIGQYSAADVVPSAAQKEISELDLPGVHAARTQPPLEGYPVPTPVSEAGLSALGKVGSGIVQGAKSVLPSAGATIEETAANVTKWAAHNGLKAAGGVGAAWYLIHELLSGKHQ